MLNFFFPEKGLGVVSPPHFVYGFSMKIFSCYILLTDQISLPDCLYFSRYLAIRVLLVRVLIVCLPGCDVINFAINLSNQAVLLQD